MQHSDLLGGKQHDFFAAYPDWSSAGLIAFNTNDLRLRHSEPHWIYTVTPDGTGVRRLVTSDPSAPGVEVEAGHARFTAAGGAMTYSLLLDGEAYLAVMNADGSGQQLVPGPVWGTFSELRPVAP